MLGPRHPSYLTTRMQLSATQAQINAETKRIGASTERELKAAEKAEKDAAKLVATLEGDAGIRRSPRRTRPARERRGDAARQLREAADDARQRAPRRRRLAAQHAGRSGRRLALRASARRRRSRCSWRWRAASISGRSRRSPPNIASGGTARRRARRRLRRADAAAPAPAPEGLWFAIERAAISRADDESEIGVAAIEAAMRDDPRYGEAIAALSPADRRALRRRALGAGRRGCVARAAARALRRSRCRSPTRPRRRASAFSSSIAIIAGRPSARWRAGCAR